MAKENYISLRGQIRGDVIMVSDDNGNPITALFSMHTLKRNIYDQAGKYELKFDKPIILTSDPKMIRSISNIKKYDIVEIKGSFTTGRAVKHKKCPHCGFVNSVEVPFQVISPSYVGILKTGLKSDSEGLQNLIECAEISNVAKVIGRVCSEEIHTGDTERGDIFSTYQLAVNRKYYLYGSSDYDDHSDYPYVISYNDQAIKDNKALYQGSLVYIDGYVHTMLTPLSVECANEECGKEFTIKTQRMSLTPYSTEYLRDYNENAIEETRPNRKDDTNEYELDGITYKNDELTKE